MLQDLLGHRGAAFEAPENTLVGFAHAWRQGVRSFELDVRLSSDQQLVILHDDSLERTAGIPRRVGEFTAAQLAEIPAYGCFPDWPKPSGIPLLEDVLKAYYLDLKSWEIEIKTDAPENLEILCPKLVREIERFDLAGRVIVTSFDPLALEIMRRLAPAQRRGFISRYNQPEHLETALRLGCYRACIPLQHSSKTVVTAAHAAGLNVTGWQGDSVEMLQTLLDWDVDAITSNLPTQALAFLRERGVF